MIKCPVFSGLPLLVQILMTLSFLLPLTACELPPELISDAFLVNEEVEDVPSVPVPSVPDACVNDRFTQPDAEITRNIDILFVVDSSGSLDPERAKIAEGIDAFVAALPAEVNYQIAVMLAHGDQSSRSGKLYSAHGKPVLSSQELTLDEIRADLLRRMTNPPGDRETDGGEVGLYALSKALKPNRLKQIKAQGFFRSDAALTIVFVSDENDICAEYPDGETPVFDLSGSELSAKEKYCDGITPASVVKDLKALKGDQPLLISGIIYSDKNAVPSVGENEYGYGYIETIQLATGIAIDLAEGDLQAGLNEIGTLASIKLELNFEFKLSQTNIDPASIEVSVDGFEVDFAFKPELNEVHLTDAGEARSTVDVSFCLLEPNDPNEPNDPPNEPNDPPNDPSDPPNEPNDPPNEPNDPPNDPPNEPNDPIPDWDILGLDGASSSTSITIIWQTGDVPTQTFLEIGTDPLTLDHATIVIDDAFLDTHIITVENLNPDTQYFFRMTATDLEGTVHVSEIVSKTTKP